MLTLKVNGSEIPQEVLKLVQRSKSTLGLMKVVGRRASNEFKEHFRDLNSRKKNKRGFRRQNFWNRIANSTSLTASDEKSATITVSDYAYGAKIDGADITPDKAGALAIPLTSKAYGHSPRSLDNPLAGKLQLIPRKGKPSILATLKPSGDIETAHYILLRRVRVPAEPEALPPPESFWAAISEEIKDYYED